MTLLIGSEGSMGKRYQAILKSVGKPFVKYDMRLVRRPKLVVPEGIENFIIATPTDTHFWFIDQIDKYEKPILCEKPLATNLEDVEKILACKSPLSMNMQYLFLDDPGSDGISWYDYYNAGPDELKWSCFQIVALARGGVRLSQESPIWRCSLNGKMLNRADMDRAYIEAVKGFFAGQYISRETMLSWHQKVEQYVQDS